jgi:hypothetical protein
LNLNLKLKAMKKILSFILVIGTSVMMLPACQKDAQSAQISASTQRNATTAHGYDAHSIYQVELSANIPGVEGGGVWLWIGLNPSGEADYSGSDCGHGGAGAASDKGDATWHYAGANNEWLVIEGVVLNGLDGFVTTITVPSKYGHYTGTLGTYLTLPSFIPPFIGFTQLQVAP